MKGLIYIIPITKEEALCIRKQLPGTTLSHKTRHEKRYMEESRDAVRLLRTLRERRVREVHR